MTSCSHNERNAKVPAKLEVDSIDKVFLKKNLDGADSIKFSGNQIELLVNKWNHSEYKGLNKMTPKFWIMVYLKNDSIRKFRVNGDLIMEQGDRVFSIGDSLIINSFWTPKYSFQKPEDYTPLSFIKIVSQSMEIDSSKSKFGMSMINEFPNDWVKEEHLDELIELLDSKEECGCFMNPLSSGLPTGSAEKGGYAGIFLKSFKDKEKVDLGLYSCPKVDETLNRELKNWWDERNKKIKADALIYGGNVEEINQELYEKYRLNRERNSNIDSSEIRKIKGQIQIELKGKTLVFKDYFDDKCMACVIEHEVIGEIPTLNKVMIETHYFRSGISQVVDLNNGRIDTLDCTPIISPNLEFAATINYVSKDTLTEGIKIYSIEDGEFRFVRQIGNKWIPKECFWKDNDEIYAKVNLVNENQILWEKEKFIRIKKKNTEAKKD